MQGGGFMERRHSMEYPKLKRNYKDHFLWNFKIKTSFGNIKYFHIQSLLQRLKE